MAALPSHQSWESHPAVEGCWALMHAGMSYPEGRGPQLWGPSKRAPRTGGLHRAGNLIATEIFEVKRDVAPLPSARLTLGTPGSTSIPQVRQQGVLFALKYFLSNTLTHHQEVLCCRCWVISVLVLFAGRAQPLGRTPWLLLARRVAVWGCRDGSKNRLQTPWNPEEERGSRDVMTMIINTLH